ncbi:hypothetical protein L249_8350, partial [Ophiocordyceps polyrhachis-furcata BCC 54312]
VGKKDPNEVICIPSQRAEPGLITSKGYTSKELEAGEVGKPSFFYRQCLRNKEEDLYVPYPAVSAVLRGVWVRIRLYL